MMSLRKQTPFCDASSVSRAPLNFSKVSDKVNLMDLDMPSCFPLEPDVDIDLSEVYFLILHFLSTGPCKKTFGQYWDELLEHQLLPRRYHARYSRSGARNADKDEDGKSLPLCYPDLVERYPHIEKDHLVKLLKQLIVSCSPQFHGTVGGTAPNAADVPTILGSGSFSLLASVRDREEKKKNPLPGYLRWPHMQADQVRGLSLREIGGGFTRHHRAPSVRAACYAIAKPSALLQKMQVTKKMRGHQNAVYCAIIDRSGRYVITGSDDRLVKIWSMETAFCLASCRGHEGDITDLAVSSNNALVASSSNDFSIRVWRLPDGLPISVLRGHTGAVTAIAFSPRSVYQLLSSSDDGCCRIWDARHSQLNPRIYIPKPPDPLVGKGSDPSSVVGQQNHQILCCSYNANGTVFVTGSSDTYARVWNACKFNQEDSDQPNHEMDLLSGHENDVNYVQFSGCAVVSKSSTADTLKEDNIPKFKNSWFTHDNIVTCSRDGSAIIWIPRSRRSHGKVGRWTRGYHLKVPPPPLPPQPPRGGPRQRFQQTPRGVNMIVWSLDNRFVLAAIMDCRICVWNASDGSLVHSLIGHSESTFVLDVHPFNPRIAMSAGYDGKTIIWDIWEGTPVRIYETGRFKLVDGKFSPDGTSIVLSDDVGQIFIIATGQGESQKDAKYDQFFLGDYRPLIQDTNGNVVDQETQLVPYRRNIQDLLCDSGMIPYPEPYQNMYQQRRLATLGIEWRPSSMKFAVGPTYSTNAGDYIMPPIVVDLESWEPLPTFIDAIDWEPENEVQSDDNDSEYNVTDEYSTEVEVGNLGTSSSGEPEHFAGDIGIEHNNRDSRRRSKRKDKKKKSEVALLTSSGRRIKRKNLDECEGSKLSKKHRKPKARHGPSTSRKKPTKSKALCPRRRSARNALNFFSKITGSSSDEEDVFLESSSESDSELPYSSSQGIESERSMQQSDIKTEMEVNDMFKDDNEDVSKPSQPTELTENPPNRRRLILKLPRRESKAIVSSENTRRNSCDQEIVDSLSKTTCDETEPRVEHSLPFEATPPSGDTVDAMLYESAKIRKRREAIKEELFNRSEGFSGSSIRWQEINPQSIKRVKMEDTNGNTKFDDEDGTSSTFESRAFGDNLDVDGDKWGNGAITRENLTDIIFNSTTSSKPSPVYQEDQCATLDTCNGITETASQNASHGQEPVKNTLKFRIKSNGSMKLKSVALDELSSVHDLTSAKPYKDEGTSSRSLDENSWNDDGSGTLDTGVDKSNYSKKSHFHFNNQMDAVIKGVRRTRSMGTKVETGKSPMIGNSSEKESYGSLRSSRNVDKHLIDDEWKPNSNTIGLRSTRNRRENNNSNLRPLENSKHQQTGRKLSWLMLVEHEECYRYIPQLGDEVAYLRQGHEEYIKSSRRPQEGPFRIKGLKAVEFCKIQCLDYSTLPGSGESCCKLSLEFIDPSSSGFGKTFKLTLAELVSYPDFLVEKTRYDASIERNWTQRDKCQVWWRNEDGTSGSWWEGRVLEVKPKSAEFPYSPWERYVIKYKSDPSGEHSHSPWELHDAEILWEHPHVDEDIRDKLLSSIAKLERASANKDKYGIHKLNQVAQKSDFLNRFPLPLSLDVIRRRLENNYYRTLEAVNHDASVMLSIAESYFGKNVEMATKMRRLSEWVDSTFSSL